MARVELLKYVCTESSVFDVKNGAKKIGVCVFYIKININYNI